MNKSPRHGRGVPAVVLACVLTVVSVHVQSQSGWTSGDVGNPAVAGASSLANGTFTVTGGGSDIWGRADQFQFVYQPVSGDVEIVARVASLSAADPWAKAGVMIRQSLASGSPHVAMLGTAGSGWTAESRSSSDGLTTDSSGPSGVPPGWVRLVRAGNLVTASHSYDGSSWSVVSSDTITLGSSVYVGLVVTGHNSEGATARATFQNVAVQGTIVGAPTPQPPAPQPPAGPTQSGWASGDIGNPAVAGASSLANGTFTVTGGGSDIWDRADQFQFVYQPVSGDVQIVARVASLSAAEPWAKAGVMIRQSLASGSPHVAMLGTAGSGWTAENRSSSDGLTTYISGPGGAPPGWVRLVRAGNVVTASHSYDGNSWSVVSSDAIALGSTVYVGLAVTSHNSDGATARATFRDVAVQGTIVGAPTPQPPTPQPPAGPAPSGWASGDIGNPAGAGTSSLANGTFTVTGGGSDIWGRADQFQFVYQPVAGDVEIVARVASLSAAEPWAKAGVMIRQSLASGSPHVAMLGTAGNGWTAESRESSDGLTTYISGPGGAPPGWVRLVRAGNVVTASHSYDGNSWSVVSSDAIALGSTVYVGLAVTSHNSDGATARATFQNVTVRAPTSGVTPPPTPTGPTRVVFVPSADHATVTSYVVSMRGAGQSTSGAPVATRDLGKPSPVNGEISIDISTLVDPLPTGSYYAVVSATGPGGTSPSTPSPTFAK